MPVTAPDVLTLDEVAVTIARTPVLDSVDLRLRPGKVTGVIGANGTGKTTLLELCATLRRPARGSGQVLGARLAAAGGSTVPPDVRRRICLVGHQPALYSRLSLRENLAFVARLYRRPLDRVEQVLTAVGLARAADRRLEQCSQGMGRRADLARALLTEPTLLLLDEAHSGLDEAAVDLVGHVVGQVRERGGAALVVSHDREGLDTLADEVATLADGRLTGVGGLS